LSLLGSESLARVLYQEVTLMARKSTRLGEKLRSIRLSLDLSQNGILRRLGLDDELTQAEWSAYERGVRIPSLPVLLMIAELAGVWMDVLVSDDLDIPKAIPAKPRSEGIRRKSGSKNVSTLGVSRAIKHKS
jgi:transcriptional regulator with XRE-family HTH domain